MGRGRRGGVTVEIDGDNSGLKREVRESQAALGRLNASGSKVFAGAGKAGLAGAAVGIGALGAASVKAAMDAEASQARVQKMLANAGISWAEHGAQIEKTIQAHSKLTGFDDEELSESFANMVRTTKDVNKALELNALASDIARTKGMSLDAAQKLVARTYNDNLTGLNKLGIKTKDVANGQEALALLQKSFAGQAEAYGKTTAGQADRIKVAWENFQEAFGARIMPAVAKAMEIITDILNGDWAKAWAGIKVVAKKALDGVVELLKNLAGRVGSAAKSAGLAITRGILNGLIGLAEGVLRLVVAPVNAVIAGINSAIGAANKVNPFDDIPNIPGISVNLPRTSIGVKTPTAPMRAPADRQTTKSVATTNAFVGSMSSTMAISNAVTSSPAASVFKTQAKTSSLTAEQQRGARAIIEVFTKYGLDPAVGIAVALSESNLRPGAIGDGGHSVGLFQLNDLGAGAGMSVAQRSDPYFNAGVAARAMVRLGGRGLSTADAVALMVRKFERPADIPGRVRADIANIGDARSILRALSAPGSTPGRTVADTPAKVAPSTALRGILPAGDAPSGLSPAADLAIARAGNAAAQGAFDRGQSSEQIRAAREKATQDELKKWLGQELDKTRARLRVVRTELAQARGRRRAILKGMPRSGPRRTAALRDAALLYTRIRELMDEEAGLVAWEADIMGQQLDIGIQERADSEQQSSTPPPGDNGLLEAQLAQQTQLAQTNANATRSLEQFIATAFGPGDIGAGAGSAWQAAGGVFNLVQIQALHPGDPTVLAAIAAAVAKGGQVQGGRANPAVVTGL